MRLFKKLVFLLLCLPFALQAQYSRVVSLAPSITKSVYFLDAQNKLVGSTNYCTTRPGDNIEVVSSPVTVNIEKVVSLEPDLVLATTITNPEHLEMLKKMGIKVKVFPTPKSFEEICAQFIEMGTLLGKEARAIHITDSVRAEVDGIKAWGHGVKPLKIFFQIGAEPLYTVIPNTFMNDYITFLQAENIASDLTRGTISRESVLLRKPDYIFIVTMGIVGKEEMKTWKSYTDLPATKNNHIYVIDSDIACTPTPQTFLQTLQIINKQIKE